MKPPVLSKNLPNKKTEPVINFRLPVFCALGACFGILFYVRARFGGLTVADFFFPVLLLAALYPFSWRRAAVLAISVLLFAGAGAGLMHWKCERFRSGLSEGDYTVEGTVVSCSEGNGYSAAVLGDLAFDGARAGGKMRVYLSADVGNGDRILFSAKVRRTELSADSYGASLLSGDIRYTANAEGCTVSGKTKNPFLLLDGAIGEALHANLGKDEADVAYALLLGHSEGMDEGIAEGMRRGGVAHIFAVSGLHIGILYAATKLLFRKLRKYDFLPASAVSFLYCVLCGFSVSALRAFIMCTVLGVNSSLGRKSDFPNAVGLAALPVLLLFPAEFLCVGFRLSFGACIGLALFSGSLSRGMKKLPRPLASYLSSALSVQIFTFPILLSSFGYFSVWGFVMNFFLIPLLPVLFLTVLLTVLFALLIPPAAPFFLFFAGAVVSPLIETFTLFDLFVLSGFSLAAGGSVWIAGCVLLSEKVRMTPMLRAGTALLLAVLFLFSLTVRNMPVTDCTVIAYHRNDADALLIRTRQGTVLAIDDDITLSECEDFLERNYGGELEAVILLAEDPERAVNVAAFLPAKEVRAPYAIDAGFQELNIAADERFYCNGVEFWYVEPWKLLCSVPRFSFEADFDHPELLLTGHFFGGGENAVYYIWNGRSYRTDA